MERCGERRKEAERGVEVAGGVGTVDPSHMVSCGVVCVRD